MSRRVTFSLAVLVLFCGFGAPIALAQGPGVPCVEPGTGFYQSSVCYGVNPQGFSTVNSFMAPDYLYASQPLVVTTWTDYGWPPPPLSAPSCYMVRRGDTLARIAAWYGTSVHCLAAANSIPNPNLIHAGQCLRIVGPECDMGCPSCFVAHNYVQMPIPTPAPITPTCGSSAAPNPSSYWCAEFYGNGELAGPPLLSRMDRDIRFAWGYASPAPGVPTDNFSVRWTRTMGLPAGKYTITACSDDGVQVYVDSLLVIDAWQVQSGQCHTEKLDFLSSITRTMIVKYFEADGAAQIEVTIQPL